MTRSKTAEGHHATRQPQGEWHALEIEAVFAELDTGEAGLTKTDVEERRARMGANMFTEVPRKGILARIYGQLKSPLTFVLVLAFLVTFVLREFVDASVIAFALIIAVLIGILQEGRASRAFKKLADSQTHTATVIRDGKQHVVPAEEVVVGDIVEVAAGTQVPADVRIFDAKALEANEAALTGEWLGVSKHTEPLVVGLVESERTNMLFKGTNVTRGRGRGVVVATGDNTVVGELARDVQRVVEEKTPLQVRMERISRIMLTIIVILVAAIFVIGALRNVALSEMLITAIAIAVASVPEGLPAAVTIVLAVAMEALLKKGGLVRNLLAAETLGSTTYILTDKTGTLTRARMSISHVLTRSDTYRTAEATGEWKEAAPVRSVLEISLTATEAFVDEQDDGVLTFSGEPMERAILRTADAAGIDSRSDSMRANRSDHLAFNSENRFALGLTKRGKTHRLCINGAPELLLDSASHVIRNGRKQKIIAADKRYFTGRITEYTKEGMRLIAVGYKDIDTDDIPDDAGPAFITDLVFAGLLVFHDPVREGVEEAISDVRRAGMRVLLVTGDNPETALSIARETGIAAAGDRTHTGRELEEMDDMKLAETLRTCAVFARVLPHQKMRLASVLQGQNEVVAMTGDGVNDASALQKANIGVAVGSGTEVAKAAADLVLINDSFAIIRAAIEEGRRIISNLRKIVGYLISTSLSEVVLIGAALIVGLPVPLTAPQILWANIIEEGLMSVAFAFEPGEKNAMQQKPHDIRREGILSAGMLRFMALVVCSTGALLLLLYWYVVSNGADLREVRSTMFLAVAIDSLFIAFSFRSLSVPLWRINLRSNIFFLGSFFISAALLLIVLTVPFFQYLLSYEPIGTANIAIVALFGVLTLVIIEIGKWIFFERK